MRPYGLQQLIGSISEQTQVETKHPIELIILDNDCHGSASGVLKHMQLSERFRLHYEVEPVRGIAYARNRCVRLALAMGANVIAFLDDDETTDREWLSTILACMEEYDAPVVFGLVKPFFDCAPPRWVQEGNYFIQQDQITGEPHQHISTGNVIIRREVFDAIGMFDKRWGLQGGSDLEFFTRVSRAGFRLIGCNEAITHHRVSLRRATRLWLLQRAFRWGNETAAIAILHDSRFRRRAILIEEGVRTALEFVIPIIGSLFRLNLSNFFQRLRMIAKGAGLICGALGYRYEEYRYFAGSEDVTGSTNELIVQLPQDPVH